MPDFPSDFTFGVSTSAYQIEGGVREGGRGETVWDRVSHLPGKILNGDHGDVAADHFHRYREDIHLMKELGLDAYRFSVSWTRLFPDGRGAFNREGFGFYDRLIDELLDAGIDPWVCYYHFDLPQLLHIKGGWANRDVAHWYADYVAALSERIKDRVTTHVLMNEPTMVVAMSPYLETRYQDYSRKDILFATVHHLNLATGLGSAVLRECSSAFKVGTALEAPYLKAGRDEEEDHLALETAAKWFYGAWLDPLLKGTYPDSLYEGLLPFIKDGDLKLMAEGPGSKGQKLLVPGGKEDDHTKKRASLDFIGLNHYTLKRIVAAKASRGFAELDPPKGAALSEMGLELSPEVLGKMLEDVHRAWPDLPLFILENGGAFPDHVSPSGRIEDADRTRFLAESLQSALEAMDKGVPLKGYFVWSLMDNFEWMFGYERTFGLVHIDPKTRDRAPKASYSWYQDVVQSRRLK